MLQMDKQAPYLGNKLILLLSDVVAFGLALLFSLYIRYGLELKEQVFLANLHYFSYLFALWVASYFVLGFYEMGALRGHKLTLLEIIKVQIWNSFLAVGYFYFLSKSSVSPKTILVIDFIATVGAVYFMRQAVGLVLENRRKQSAVVVGSGAEVSEFVERVNSDRNYFYTVCARPEWPKCNDQDKLCVDAKIIILNPERGNSLPAGTDVSDAMVSGIRLIDFRNIYESVFGKIPLDSMDDLWVMRNISNSRKFTYDFLKRTMDIIISLLLGIAFLPLFPLIALAIKLDDGGPVFYSQKRYGRFNRLISITKFRTMSVSDKGAWLNTKSGSSRVTRVGAILRRTRIDEIPQLWSVILGVQSLVGPRPEIPELADEYAKQIPYYTVRHLIKPGLSGWAQMYHKAPPHHETNVEATRGKLAYDLYYLKNRNIILDLSVALKTIRILLSCIGI